MLWIVEEIELALIHALRHRRRSPHHLVIGFDFPNMKVRGVHMDVSLNAAQAVTATASYVDANGGKPTNPPTNPSLSWSVADTSVATLDGSPSTSSVLTAVAVGVTTLTVTDGTFTATAQVTVTEDAVAGLSITFGTPSP